MSASQTAMPVIAVRADAGPDIGYGHVCRTLATVEAMRAVGEVSACYWMAEGSDARSVLAAGHAVRRFGDCTVRSLIGQLDPGAGPLLLDTPGWTPADLQALAAAGICTVVFDDRQRTAEYPVAVVVDAAPGAEKLAYRGAAATRFCLGPAYFAMRAEFHALPPRPALPAAQRRVVVTFGGSDPEDCTSRIADALARHPHPWWTSFLLGPGYRGCCEAIVRRKLDTADVHRNNPPIAELFGSADLAISAAGTTALELAFLGVPAVLISLAQDQQRVGASLAEAGAAVYLGPQQYVQADGVWRTAAKLVEDEPRRLAMQRAGQGLCDGRGARRIAEAVLKAWRAHHPTGQPIGLAQ